MRLASVAVAVIGALAGCAGPMPAPTGTTGATSAASVSSSVPAHEALRASAAAALGVEPDQLVLVEDGFVAARFGDDTELELVWIGPVNGALEDRVLATVEERRSRPGQSLGSIHAAVCPVELGMARTRFLFGQETLTRRLVLTGPTAAGGDVAGGTYVFAISGDTFDGLTQLRVTDDLGRDIASGEASWLAPPTVPTADGACTVTSEH